MLDFALNQVTMSQMPFGRFVDTAAALGCVGVEARNDLGRAMFDGMKPSAAGDLVRGAGLRLLGLSQVYPFNRWSDAVAVQTRALIDLAGQSGAETISLIPCNDPSGAAPHVAIGRAIEPFLPLLQDADVVALIEPLGFAQASLRQKAEVVRAIDALGAQAHVRLVHDTFHHALAGGGDVFPTHTGLVHVSGVTADIPYSGMQDADRVLVGLGDRLDNIGQLQALIDAGYSGPFSFECFAPAVREMPSPEGAIKQSMDFISSRLQRQAA